MYRVRLSGIYRVVYTVHVTRVNMRPGVKKRAQRVYRARCQEFIRQVP